MRMAILEAAFWQDVLGWLLTHGLRIVAIVVAAFLLRLVLRKFNKRLDRWINSQEHTDVRMLERQQRINTVRHFVKGMLLVVLTFIAALMVLMELGLPVAPLLAGAGVIGIAISLGAQTLVKDMLAGLFIMIEGQFCVGDSITTAGISGAVERITLRATTLRDLEGTAHVIPNGSMQVVSNKTKDWSRMVLRVGVAYDTNLDRAAEVLAQVLEEMAGEPEWQSKFLEMPRVVGVDDLRESDITLLITAKTAPGEQWAVSREARKRIVPALTREGIEMPYPTQVSLMRIIDQEGRPAAGPDMAGFRRPGSP